MTRPTILIANPCDTERALLRHALEGRAFKVVEAASAKEALDKTQVAPVQLVLLDTLNWHTAAANALTALKGAAQMQRVPVVMFGQPQEKQEVIDCIQKGAATWIGRQGFQIEKFCEKLTTIVRQAAPTPGSAAPTHAGDLLPVVPGASLSRLEKLTPEAVSEFLKSVGTFPAFEFNIVETVTTAGTRDQVIDKVAALLARDPMITLATLGAANQQSHSDRPIADAAEALSVIGLKGFYKLAESIPPVPLNLASIWDPGCFWAHSTATARIAAMLSRQLDLGSPGAALSAGLLHDIGYFILAQYFPKHYGALFSAGLEAASINPIWEKNLIGLHHGEIAACLMQSLGLPPILCEPTMVHHSSGTLGQTLTPSARLLAMVVQAADCLADALFPGDPPLTPLTNPHEEFEKTLLESDLEPQAVLDGARKIMAELLTEMSFLFPQSAARSFYYRCEPLGQVAYFAPGRPAPLDLVRVFLEIRSEELVQIERVSARRPSKDIPMVANLTRVHDLATQIEILTSLMASHTAEGRRGVVLLPAIGNKGLANIIPASWRLVSLPAHPSHWMRLLRDDQNDVAPPQLWVA